MGLGELGLGEMGHNRVDEAHQSRGHTAKIVKTHYQLDIRRFFFSNRVVNRWNQLDQDSIDSNTINCFKNNLERTRNTRMGFFTDQLVRQAG